VKILALVELLGGQGERIDKGEREMLRKDLPELQKALGLRSQISVRKQWVDCLLPRVIRIDTIHEGNYAYVRSE
jgi:hypothetical protein